MNRNQLAASIISALLLAACSGGGGGGNVRTETPPPPPPPTTPPPPPPPTTCTDPNANNNGGPLPCTYRYNGIADNLLVPTNVDQARAAGFNGQGVRVGLLDDAQMPYAPIDGRVASYTDYTGQGAEPTTNGQRGHGTMMAGIITGQPQAGFNGGVAPGAQIFWGRTCYNNSCSTQQAGQAFTAMTAQGVRLFNYSIGAFYEGQAAQTAAANFLFYARPVIQNDGLIVAATGNGSQQTSNYPAAAPVHAPELRYNMLAVANVTLDAQGKPNGLAASSNWCGDAKDWCLVAPGRLALPGLAGTDYTNGVDGTSASTALVTGVGALTLQAFPWMSARNLQTTLLTTATDLGDAGVDRTYGWGMVNAARAVRGPGQFLGTFQANVFPGTYEFSNNIGGTGGLVKQGAGTLILSGTNTYTGETEVVQGTLGLKGNVAGNVIVRSHATFAAMGGRVGGDYFIGGTDAITSIQLGKPLEIGGQATLTGGILNLQPEATTYTVGTTETLVRANNIVGVFNRVTFGNNFFWDVTLNYTGTTVTGSMNRRASAQSLMAASASASVVDGARQADALIDALDRRFVAGETTGLEGLYGAAASLINASDEQVAASLPTLTGQVHGIQRAIAVQGALNDSRIAADRLPLLAGTEQETTWVQVDSVDGTLKRKGYADSEYRQSGITLGVDIPVGNAILGASVSKGRTEADVIGANSHLENDRFAVTGYGYLPVGKSAYVSGVIGIDSTDVETTRGVQFGSGSETIRNERDESAIHARVEGGIKLESGLTPFAAIGTVHHTQEAFSETSASGLGLTAPKDSLDAIFADAGVRFDKSIGAWEIGGLLAYRNVFAGDDTSFNAWFTALPDAAFTVNGQPIARDSVRALLGAGYKIGGKAMVYGNVGYESHTNEGDNVTANLGVRWSF